MTKKPKKPIELFKTATWKKLKKRCSEMIKARQEVIDKAKKWHITIAETNSCIGYYKKRVKLKEAIDELLKLEKSHDSQTKE